MSKKPVFYSFHYDNDVMRVQMIRNIGALEDNEPVSPNAWEEVKRKGDTAIRAWIDESMSKKKCVVILVGSDTASRPWVNYEIRRAWDTGKGLFGVYIHNIKCPNNGFSRKGRNPFEGIKQSGADLSSMIDCYDPTPSNAYGEIRQNMERWVDRAIAQRGG